jgi:hypothetical protein
MAAQLPPPGCGCELQQAPTEYDYLPAPTITSVSTSSGPASLAGEPGGTVITVTGTGFDPLGIDWADFGPPSLDSSVDTNYVFVSGTDLQIAAPPEPQTVAPASIPLRIRTLAGLSAPATVSYAGVPTVTRVLNAVNAKQLNGVSGGPSTGGTPIQINGHGFAGQLLSPLQFADADPTGGSFGTQYTFTVRGDTSISTETVAQAPGIVDVELCTVTGCSHNPPADRFYLYPPGDAAVASVSPGSGPAAGGTHVAIAGQNLGCALGVFFGSAAAESFSRVLVPGNDCASPTTLRAASPPGSAGASVPVSVATVESFFTGSGGTTSASFAYK